MRIKKVENIVGLVGHVLNNLSKSKNDTYSADYLNDRIIRVSSTQPITGEKVWINPDDNRIYIKNDDDVYVLFDNNVVDSGSNSLGSWVKYADGRMECSGTINLGQIAYNTEYGYSFIESSSQRYCEFPSSFKEDTLPVVVLTASLSGGVGYPTLYSRDSDKFRFFVASVSKSSLETDIHYIAKGYWK